MTTANEIKVKVLGLNGRRDLVLFEVNGEEHYAMVSVYVPRSIERSQRHAFVADVLRTANPEYIEWNFSRGTPAEAIEAIKSAIVQSGVLVNLCVPLD